ncbi:putative ionotropic glutamate receptor [Helianthus annuus]|nr:putative ionotropic glutamate receptor [Helianthus annuus]
MSTEIYMLVPAARKWNQTLVTLIRPFTIKLWIAIITACIFIGVAIGYLEYRGRNPEFLNVPFYQKLFMIIWFPVSRFFYQEGRIHNRCSKVVLVIWLIMIFIVMQIFTACLSSWLTVNQLQPQVPKQYQEVGYQDGSFVMDFLKGHVQSSLRADKLKGLPLSSLDDYKNVLDNRVVDAIIDELPYIEIFLAKHGTNYMKVGPLAGESGLGFAFSRGSQIQPEFSRAVIRITESPAMTDMKKIYLPNQTPLPTQPDDSFPESLDIHSFYLLFIFMGVATIIAIICSEILLMRTQAQISPEISRNMMSTVQAICANSKQIAENEQ